MTTLRKVTPADRTLLFNLLQKYLCEMTRYYPDPVDDDGTIDYPYFDAYFTDDDRAAYILLSNGQIAGFAMVNRHSCIGETIDHAMAEFFVLPSHRRNGVARDAVKLLLPLHPGRWEIKYHLRNEGAAAFWQEAVRCFAPAHRLLPEEEAVYFFTVEA